MNCMKCGREINEGVFCYECLADMEKYPVKPGTVVQLPRREQSHPMLKKMYPRKRSLSAEEQVVMLRQRLKILTVALIITMLIAVSLVYPAVSYMLEGSHFLPGQNYTAIVPTTEEAETVPPVIIPPPSNTVPIPEETV